jgi:nicotinamide-nucleotide amidase
MGGTEQNHARDSVDAATTRPTVAVAESLTGGMVCSALARREGAGDWFMGGIVAYTRAVKETLLDIGDAPVVSEDAARAMANSVANLLCAEFSVAVTGVGGPGPEDGVEPGTVWIAVHGPEGTTTRRHCFDGDPSTICERTRDVAIAALERVIGAPIGSSC